MAAFSSKLIFIIILLLTGTLVKAEVPVSSPAPDNFARNGIAAASSHNATGSREHWQIRPGEDIMQIARLMFPEDPVARNNFIRAIIHTNPEHFPGGTYQPLPAGTIIHFPDLRTISNYAKPATRTKESGTTNSLSKTQSAASTLETGIARLSDNQPVLKLIAKLEQIAENETNGLNALLKRIESLEKQIATMQSMLASRMATPSEQHLTDTTTTAADSAQPVAKTITPTETDEQQPNSPTGPDETNSKAPMEFSFFSDSIFLFGLLLTLLIIILMLRNHQKIKERFTQSTDVPLPDVTERQRYEALLLQRSDKPNDSPKNTPETPGYALSEARALIEQDNPDAAIQLLQQQLATNPHDIPSWLLLFEQLYKSNNKSDFKKNARRFKRMGKFSDIWIQIQKLGNKLEPNEPLYFDELKRKEKFFSDASGSD